MLLDQNKELKVNETEKEEIRTKFNMVYIPNENKDISNAMKKVVKNKAASSVLLYMLFRWRAGNGYRTSIPILSRELKMSVATCRTALRYLDTLGIIKFSKNYKDCMCTGVTILIHKKKGCIE